MKNPKKSNHIFLTALSVSIIILLIGMTTEILPLTGVGLLLAFLSFVFRVLTFRCPYCGHYMGRQNSTHCPRCRKKIES